MADVTVVMMEDRMAAMTVGCSAEHLVGSMAETMADPKEKWGWRRAGPREKWDWRKAGPKEKWDWRKADGTADMMGHWMAEKTVACWV